MPVSVVEAVAEQGGLKRAAEDVRARIAALDPPPGVQVTIGGAEAEQERTTRELTLVAIGAGLVLGIVFGLIFGASTVFGASAVFDASAGFATSDFGLATP